LLEGLAEATAGLSKGYFGKLSDSTGKRVPFVQLGYTLSALAKPMMAMFAFPLWVFLSRTMDRFGKGIRTGARDALLSDEATPATKGKIFGFHRSLDTLGAVLGPLLALLYLYKHPSDYKTLFFLAFIPGLLAICATFFLKKKSEAIVGTQKKVSFFSFFSYWKTSSTMYKKVVVGLLVFTLFNSSDIFLLLKAKEAGLSDSYLIGIYIFYNLVYALFAFPLGILADKIQLKKMYVFGLSIFAIVYFGMSQTKSVEMIIAFFFLYGLYAAATEGISKAWITNISDKKDSATAIGSFAGFQSIATMLASSMAGLIWYQFGANAIFMLSAIITCLVIAYFIFMVRPEVKNTLESVAQS
jgi:MFS family permease